MISPRQLRTRYQQGDNIAALLRGSSHNDYQGERLIEVSYDLQSGSYTDLIRNETERQAPNAYAGEISQTIESLGAATVLEAGVGEATTLSRVIEQLGSSRTRYAGFDLSWSRVAAARNWLRERSCTEVSLCVASLLEIPYCQDAFDVVYTSHAIESNGGREREILVELHRVTREWLVLFEPCHELATDEGKRRMEQFGYCRKLPQTCTELGFDVVDHGPVKHPTNLLNPTARTIVRKRQCVPVASQEFACPQFKTPLQLLGDAWYSPEALSVYPILGNIPCLRSENAIVAGTWPDVVRNAQAAHPHSASVRGVA